MGDFEKWATAVNDAISAFAKAEKTQMVAYIGPNRAEWKWGTRGCVATPTPDGKSVSVLFGGCPEMRMLIGVSSAALEDGRRIAESLLLGSS